jgi:hypothetical protein
MSSFNSNDGYKIKKLELQFADIASINLKNQYGLKTGKTLYYDSITNKHWYDQAFTQAPQPIADILNQVFIDYKGKDSFLFIPAGYYLIDKPLTLQDGVNLVGVQGKTKFIVDDTFALTDDFIVTNTSGANIYIDGISIEYKGFKTPCFANPSDVANSKEGIILKLATTNSVVIKNSSFIVKNNGIKTRCTPIFLRTGYKKVDIFNNYIENSSSGISTGSIWLYTNAGAIAQNVKIYDNTIVHNTQDEPIAIWGTGTHQDYEIYNNMITVPSDSYNTLTSKLISIVPDSTGTYKNIKIYNNDAKLYGNVARIFAVGANAVNMTNIIYEGNTIVDYASDATSNILFSVCSVSGTYSASDTSYQDMYKRTEVIFRRNSYISKSSGGRRCFAYSDSAFLRLIENTVDGYFGYGIIYIDATYSHSKIISIGNDYNFSSINRYPMWAASTKYNAGDIINTGSKVYQCTVAGTSSSTSPSHTTGTATDGNVTWLYLNTLMLCKLANVAGNYLNLKFSNDKIASSTNMIVFIGSTNTNITDITVENCTLGGTAWNLFQLFGVGNINSRLNFINNLIGDNFNTLIYAPDTFAFSVGNANFKGNKFLNALTNMTYNDNASNAVVTNSAITVNSNTYANGETDNLVKAAPTNTNIFKLFETGRVMLNIGSGANRCWAKQADGSWLSS